MADTSDRCIFVSDLPYKTTNKHIEAAFCKYGVLENIHIKTTEYNMGTATVQFDKQSSAEDACADVEDIIIR